MRHLRGAQERASAVPASCQHRAGIAPTSRRHRGDIVPRLCRQRAGIAPADDSAVSLMALVARLDNATRRLEEGAKPATSRSRMLWTKAAAAAALVSRRNGGMQHARVQAELGQATRRGDLRGPGPP